MKNIPNELRTIPQEPGVYLYKNSIKEIIYVGKAKNLRKRVNQYFQKGKSLGLKTNQLVSQIEFIHVIPTTSEFDAILLEAKLIRANLPKYNAVLRDDKSPLYICLTFSEKLPRVLYLRKSQLGPYEKQKRNAIFGPLQSPGTIYTIMRQLRYVIPYCTQKIRNGKPCFYTHLGLCNPCASEIIGMEKSSEATATYRQNIRKLQQILEGKSTTVLISYEHEMEAYAARQEFEKAHLLKTRILALSRIGQLHYDPQIFIDRGTEDIYAQEIAELLQELKKYFPNLKNLDRIECFDISHLAGTNTVGSMVVLTNGKPDLTQYRRFRIQTVKGISDVDSMKEVLTRRMKHKEWGTADFILIDGGKPQVSAIQSLHITIPTAGLSKRFEELIIPFDSGYTILRLPLNGKAIKVLERIRDEAHRFAITYNRVLRNKQLLENV